MRRDVWAHDECKEVTRYRAQNANESFIAPGSPRDAGMSRERFAFYVEKKKT